VTRDDFTCALEQQLHLDGVPFCREELLVFVSASWPLMQSDQHIGRWATAFVNTFAEGPLAGVGEPD
jgi:hypothetical protein